MKLFFLDIRTDKKSKILSRKTLDDHKNEVLIQHGKEQFENLVKRGIRIPIALS